MTKKENKRRPSRKSTESPSSTEGTTDAPAKSDSGNSGKAGSGSAESGSVPKAKRSSLPAFGFAADLLKKKADEGGAEDAPTGTEAPKSEPAEAAADAVPAGGGEPALDGHAAGSAPAAEETSPTRIFDFADQLDARNLRDAEKADEVRLGTFVTFSLADETFAMPVEPVRQVVRVSSITRVPHAPRPVRGVTNLRGRVIPVIDLRTRVGLSPTEIDRSARVIAVNSKGRLLGLLVDAVHQVVHLDLNRVQPPPEDVMTFQSDYIEGVYGEGEDLVLLLDVDRALIIREVGAA